MNKELDLIDIWTEFDWYEQRTRFDWHKNWIWYLFNCTHSLRSFVWCDMNNCIQRTEFVVHINQFSHLTSDLHSWMLFLDTETRLDWIQITSTWKHTWIEFEFTGGMFLCQIDIWTKIDWHMNKELTWYIKFDLFYIWHRNTARLNSNHEYMKTYMNWIWIHRRYVSVSRNNIHECKSEVKCENWLIWTTNSVLWMQLFISHHTNERSEWVNHMSIKFSSYVNQIQFFICQSSPVVNQIQFFVHMSIKIDFCFIPS